MKKLFLILLVPVLGMMIFSCQCETKTEDVKDNDALLYSTLFVQRAAEYKALCYQAYNSAHLSLDEKVENYEGSKKLAVVVDIDETVLDNSPHAARSILENTNYPKYWDEWCNLAEAKVIPGSLAFLKYAETKGVETFYISNRKAHLTAVTLKNLQAHGFPFADETHIMLRTSTSDKEERRNKVRETHDIIILCGDNLGDFSSEYDDKNTKTRNELAANQVDEFGATYIVLPNPTYGAWLGAMTKGAPIGINMDSLYKTKLINFELK
ncbi:MULTISPECIES: 5'-nucleotidase, lipoprotein e(P4) family [unclassified Lentimicrobium]|uniref:5'-nucleotidase, lipoprotein e(P4) family n=1 Tax=unclassified Lentimicrobium TaxID=2677434 RepID=UPI001554F597|nr:MULTISPECIES: 5'-nucleotidase, lipoprotein e(P4) family [unclassified Lentimicrobium]NPD47563.1 5'-nucleotidase, lipoprotein e(P4) family [Lentimicrobium sp. S6]NPD86346.1 5'-nucleotidase, lipoprotein e(P4) family [Lentimicrobium sp. L6]